MASLANAGDEVRLTRRRDAMADADDEVRLTLTRSSMVPTDQASGERARGRVGPGGDEPGHETPFLRNRRRRRGPRGNGA